MATKLTWSGLSTLVIAGNLLRKIKIDLAKIRLSMLYHQAIDVRLPDPIHCIRVYLRRTWLVHVVIFCNSVGKFFDALLLRSIPCKFYISFVWLVLISYLSAATHSICVLNSKIL